MPWSKKKASYSRKRPSTKKTYRRKTVKKTSTRKPTWKKAKTAFRRKAVKKARKGRPDIAGATFIAAQLASGTMTSADVTGPVAALAKSGVDRAHQRVLKYHGLRSPWAARYLSKMRFSLDGASMATGGGINSEVIHGNDLGQPAPNIASNQTVSFFTQAGALYVNYFVHGAKCSLTIEPNGAEIHPIVVYLWATMLNPSTWNTSIPRSPAAFEQWPGVFHKCHFGPNDSGRNIGKVSLYCMTKDLFGIPALDMDDFSGLFPNVLNPTNPGPNVQWYFGFTCFDVTDGTTITNLPTFNCVVDYDVEMFTPMKDSSTGQPTLEDDFTDMSIEEARTVYPKGEALSRGRGVGTYGTPSITPPTSGTGTISGTRTGSGITTPVSTPVALLRRAPQ